MFLSFVSTKSQSHRNQTPALISYNIRQENEPYQPLLPSVIQRNFQNPLTSTQQSIANLKARLSNWDGYHAPAPNPCAICSALDWVENLYERISNTQAGWHAPYVSSDEEGNVSLEWWHDERKLTIYVLPAGIEYVKVWGPHIISDMEDGEISNFQKSLDLWNWLYG